MNGGKGLEQVDIILHNLITDKKVPGLAITIMDNGGKVLQKGYGFADLENRDKVDPKRTVFRIASISKCITGLALGKMVMMRLIPT